MFRYFNSNWQIPDEIELTSMFVGVASVTLQIIPSRKSHKYRKDKKEKIKYSTLSRYTKTFVL